MNYYCFLEFLVAPHLSAVQRTVLPSSACSHSQGVIHVFWHIRITHKLSFDICVVTHQVYGSCEVGLSNAENRKGPLDLTFKQTRPGFMFRGGIFKVNCNFFLNQKEKTEKTKWKKEAPKCLLDAKHFTVIPLTVSHTLSSLQKRIATSLLPCCPLLPVLKLHVMHGCCCPTSLGTPTLLFAVFISWNMI